jgi:hypothetical protein
MTALRWRHADRTNAPSSRISPEAGTARRAGLRTIVDLPLQLARWTC